MSSADYEDTDFEDDFDDNLDEFDTENSDIILIEKPSFKIVYSENEEDFVFKRRNSRNYFLDNISMIPDEKTFMAVDISSRKRIGKLDESFVLNYGFEGAKFILRGRPWIIVKTEEDKLLLSQSKEIGTAPSWKT